MEQEPLQHAKEWATQTFGAAELGDPRRIDRLIKIANALAENPSASLPCDARDLGRNAGGYRFLGNPAYGHEDLLLPHWSQTYHAATQCSRTLLLADTTEFDFTRHNTLKGRGPVGNSRENIGFSLHTVLTMDPHTQAILGCMMLSPFIRQLALLGESKAERKKRERESQVWEKSIQQIGRVPEHHQWIYVSDSNSDVYTFWQTCEDLGTTHVLRVAQDRRIEVSQADEQAELNEGHLKSLARALPGVDAHLVNIAAQHSQPRREARLQINFQQVRVQPPRNGACLHKTEVVAWVVRVWESQPPEGQEPLEWILLTTLTITCVGEAWEVVQWYGWRWLLEDAPQGAQNRLSDGTAQSAKHRGPMEIARAADSHCLAFVGHSVHGAASGRHPSDQRGFAECH